MLLAGTACFALAALIGPPIAGLRPSPRRAAAPTMRENPPGGWLFRRPNKDWPGADTPVSDVMTPVKDLVTLKPAMALTEAARVLVTNDITGAPVLDADGAVVGVLSRTDLLFQACVWRPPGPSRAVRRHWYPRLRRARRSRARAHCVRPAAARAASGTSTTPRV